MTTTTTTIPAGDFGRWLQQIRAALQGNDGSNVPCGDCVGCCTSSWFVPIRPNEARTLAVIPVAMLRRSRGRTSDNWLLGYSPDGHCSLFRDNGCSIYADRPQTCRDFDCRVFAATGLAAGGDSKLAINRRVQSWEFTFSCSADIEAASAVRKAAAFIREQSTAFPAGFAPSAPTGIAALAIKVYPLFLPSSHPQSQDPTLLAGRVVDACREFDRTLGEAAPTAGRPVS